MSKSGKITIICAIIAGSFSIMVALLNAYLRDDKYEVDLSVRLNDNNTQTNQENIKKSSEDSLSDNIEKSSGNSLIDNIEKSSEDSLSDKNVYTQTTKTDVKVSNEVYNFIQVCEPYEVSSGINYKKYLKGDIFKMAGKEWSNGFTNLCYKTYMLYNLEGKYKLLTFDIGHVDGSVMIDAKISIYFDGEPYNTYIVKADELPKKVEMSVDGVKQMKIVLDDGKYAASGSTCIGFANMIIK